MKKLVVLLIMFCVFLSQGQTIEFTHKAKFEGEKIVEKQECDCRAVVVDNMTVLFEDGQVTYFIEKEDSFVKRENGYSFYKLNVIMKDRVLKDVLIRENLSEFTILVKEGKVGFGLIRIKNKK